MASSNIHSFDPVRGMSRDGLVVSRLALVDQPTNESEPKIVQAGPGILFGRPRGKIEVGGKEHLKLFAPREDRSGLGDQTKAMFAAEGDGPRIVTNRVTEREVAYEGSFVKIGQQQYTISSRKANDGLHLVRMRTGVSIDLLRGHDPEAAIATYLKANNLPELGLHGSFALDADVVNIASIEELPKHLLPGAHANWDSSRHKFGREDGVSVPYYREDSWLIGEGCRILTADPALGEDGRQRCFFVSIQNDRLVVYMGGKKGFEQFEYLELERLKERRKEAEARRARKAAQET